MARTARRAGRWNGVRLLVGLACLLGSACASRDARRQPSEAARTEPVAFELALWRAGRGLSPALAVTRQAELARECAEALETLERTWSREEDARVVRWLRAETTPDELWEACAAVLAGLERYELAAELLPSLSATAPPLRGEAARAALHRLYGRWFAQAAEAEPFLASIRRGEGTRLLLSSAAREEERSRARLLETLEHDPAQAAAWLADPDPKVRSGAARVLAREAARPGEPERARALLLGQLEREHQAEAFHEILEALLASSERAPAEDVEARRLRALLLALTRAPADLRALSVVDALTRLTWRTEGARDEDHVTAPIEGLARWLASLRERDRLRGANDADPLVGVLVGLHGLCLRARAAGLGDELRGGVAREGVLAVFADAEQDPAVRAAAAGALGVLARPEDALDLARFLGGEAGPVALEHAVLVALRELLDELPLTGEVRAELAGAAARMSTARDPDLRAKALLLCADARLEAELAALDPAFLCVALEREEDVENTRRLLQLLRRFGHEGELAALLSAPSFERQAADPTLLAELARTLGALAAGAPRAVIRAALRLAAAGGEATRLARLRAALELVADLEEVAVLELTAREHRAVAGWVWQLERAGVPAREATSRGLVFALRVLEVHLPRGEREPELSDAALSPLERAHLAARLRADLFLGGLGEIKKPLVETAFEEALALADAAQSWAVLRDRARFRAAANERLRALADYRRLAEGGAEAEPWLAIPDLRSAIELLGRLDDTGGAGSPASAGEACDLHARLVAREAWRSEPAAVRMQDLRDWVRAGLEARDAGRLARIEAALASLPLTRAEDSDPPTPAPLWLGLTREPAWFQELLDLRARVRLRLRELDARGG